MTQDGAEYLRNIKDSSLIDSIQSLTKLLLDSGYSIEKIEKKYEEKKVKYGIYKTKILVELNRDLEQTYAKMRLN